MITKINNIEQDLLTNPRGKKSKKIAGGGTDLQVEGYPISTRGHIYETTLDLNQGGRLFTGYLDTVEIEYQSGRVVSNYHINDNKILLHLKPLHGNYHGSFTGVLASIIATAKADPWLLPVEYHLGEVPDLADVGTIPAGSVEVELFLQGEDLETALNKLTDRIGARWYVRSDTQRLVVYQSSQMMSGARVINLALPCSDLMRAIDKLQIKRTAPAFSEVITYGRNGELADPDNPALNSKTEIVPFNIAKGSQQIDYFYNPLADKIIKAELIPFPAPAGGCTVGERSVILINAYYETFFGAAYYVPQDEALGGGPTFPYTASAASITITQPINGPSAHANFTYKLLVSLITLAGTGPAGLLEIRANGILISTRALDTDIPDFEYTAIDISGLTGTVIIEAIATVPEQSSNGADFGDNIQYPRTDIFFDAVTSCCLIEDYAGNGSSGYSGDDGNRLSAQVNLPTGCAFDANFVYIADTVNSSIRAVDKATDIITTIAGNGSYGFPTFDIPALGQGIGGPSGIAIHSGNIYFIDNANAFLVYIDTDGILRFVCNTPTNSTAIQIDDDGAIYVAVVGSGQIYKYASGSLDLFAGTGVLADTGDGGLALDAELYQPVDIALDRTNRKLYIVQQGSQRIRVIDLNTNIIDAFAGTGSAGFSGDDGPALMAEFANPTGIALDADLNLLVADNSNVRIRKISATDLTIETIAGSGVNGYIGNGIAPLFAAFSSSGNVLGIDIDLTDGTIYVADGGNARVRRILC